MKQLITVISIALLPLMDAPWSHAQDGKGFVINEGPRNRAGVAATAQTVDQTKTPDLAARSAFHSIRHSSFTPETLISNRCVGLVSGDSFSALSNSSTCDSFAVPPIGNAPPAPPAGPATNPREIAAILADRAMALAADPDLRISPSAIGLTGLDSYFWLAREPRPIIATADVPGVAVTAEARPVRYTWDFGDGTTRSTPHIGRRWTRRRAGNIAHLYETSDTYMVRAAVVWVARWRFGAGPWQPLGFFTTTDSIEYPVRQIVALLVRPR